MAPENFMIEIFLDNPVFRQTAQAFTEQLFKLLLGRLSVAEQNISMSLRQLFDSDLIRHIVHDAPLHILEYFSAVTSDELPIRKKAFGKLDRAAIQIDQGFL